MYTATQIAIRFTGAPGETYPPPSLAALTLHNQPLAFLPVVLCLAAALSVCYLHFLPLANSNMLSWQGHNGAQYYHNSVAHRLQCKSGKKNTTNGSSALHYAHHNTVNTTTHTFSLDMFCQTCSYSDSVCQNTISVSEITPMFSTPIVCSIVLRSPYGSPHLAGMLSGE